MTEATVGSREGLDVDEVDGGLRARPATRDQRLGLARRGRGGRRTLSALGGGAEGDQQGAVGAEGGARPGRARRGRLAVVLGVLEVGAEAVQAPLDHARAGVALAASAWASRASKVVAHQRHDDLGAPAAARLDAARSRCGGVGILLHGGAGPVAGAGLVRGSSCAAVPGRSVMVLLSLGQARGVLSRR